MKIAITKDRIFSIMTVLGAALLHLTFGFVYTVGNMNPYLIQYMGITSSQAVFFNSVMIAALAIFMPIGSYLARKIGWRIVTIASMAFTSGGLFLSGYTITVGHGAMIASYSLMYGIGMGLPYSTMYGLAVKWFPSRGPTVIGIIASGLGLGALVFIPIQTALINPNNLPTSDPKVLKSLPQSFQIMGGIILGIQIIGFALIRECKEVSVHNKFDGDQTESELENQPSSVSYADELEDDDSVVTVKKSVNYTTKEALQTPDFYIMFTINFLNTIAITLVSSTFKIFGHFCGFDDRFLATIATICSAFNCVARILWGMSIDRFSFKCPVGTLQSCWIVLLLTYPWIAFVGGPDSTAARGLYAMWTFLLFSCIAGNYALLPGVATKTFGPKYMPTTFALLYFSTAPSTMILAGIMSVFDINGKWLPVYYSGAAAAFIGLILSTFLKDPSGSCVSATNRIAALCDPCRREPHEDEEEMMRAAMENDQRTDDDDDNNNNNADEFSE